MTRRICLISVANDVLDAVLERLPEGVVLTHRIEAFDRPVSTVRLEGPGLPDWCDVHPDGAIYAWGQAILFGDGSLGILPSPPAPMQPASPYQRILEQYGHPN